jgi:GNAT superfamily N-acetyltransferase
MHVREATLLDVEAMSRVLIASITELCGADHHGEQAAIAAWTANKSPDGVRDWFANPKGRLFVAEEDGAILGVGGFSSEGEITLNYVSPEARFRGVSKAMLAHLEAAMRTVGIDEAHLESTKTARRLYLGAGWREGGEAATRFGHVQCRAMTKHLA